MQDLVVEEKDVEPEESKDKGKVKEPTTKDEKIVEERKKRSSNEKKSKSEDKDRKEKPKEDKPLTEQ